jgi:hypothetical protein
MLAAIALAVMGPMPGIVASRRLNSSARCHLRTFASIVSMSLSMPRSWLTNPCEAARARAEQLTLPIARDFAFWILPLPVLGP